MDNFDAIRRFAVKVKNENPNIQLLLTFRWDHVRFQLVRYHQEKGVKYGITLLKGRPAPSEFPFDHILATLVLLK